MSLVVCPNCHRMRLFCWYCNSTGEVTEEQAQAYMDSQCLPQEEDDDSPPLQED